MSQEHQIKVYVFPAYTAVGSPVTPQYTENAIRGEIRKVEYKPMVTDSSAWLRYSGTDETVCYLASGTSGTAVITYPRRSIDNVSGATLTGSAFDYFLSDASTMYVCGSGFTSGAVAYEYLRVYYV